MPRSLLRVLGTLFLLVPATGLAQDFFGVHGGYASAIGKTADFAADGTALEVRWRHFNRGRTAVEIVAGFTQLGLEGAIQDRIATYKALVEEKNIAAQFQGGPGNGFVVAEYGTFESFHAGLNLHFTLSKSARLVPYIDFGAAVYNWKVPFRLRFSRVPFFGEQHAYDPLVSLPFYAGLQPNEDLDFTNHHTSGGLNTALGATWRIQRHLSMDGEVRTHLLFTNGQGDRELGVDDQDYLDNISFMLLQLGMHYRF